MLGGAIAPARLPLSHVIFIFILSRVTAGKDKAREWRRPRGSAARHHSASPARPLSPLGGGSDAEPWTYPPPNQKPNLSTPKR